MISKVSSNHDDSVRDIAEQMLSVVMSQQPPFCQAVTNCHGCLPDSSKGMKRQGRVVQEEPQSACSILVTQPGCRS